jgi:hypothetical protein
MWMRHCVASNEGRARPVSKKKRATADHTHEKVRHIEFLFFTGLIIIVHETI